MIEIERTDGAWVATCTGGRQVGATAAEAIRAALGDGGASIGVAPEAIESWILEHAAQMELEAG